MRIVDANEIVKDILWVRDNDLHSGYPHAFELGAIRKALRCVEEAKTIDIESLRPQGEWLEGDWTGEIRCYYMNSRSGNNRHLCEHTPLNCETCHMNEVKHKKAKKCSVCGKQERIATKFCPNCGAKMKI